MFITKSTRILITDAIVGYINLINEIVLMDVHLLQGLWLERVSVYFLPASHLLDKCKRLRLLDRYHGLNLFNSNDFSRLYNLLLVRVIPCVTVTIFAAFFGLLLAVHYLLLARDKLLFACLYRDNRSLFWDKVANLCQFSFSMGSLFSG